MNSGIYEHFCGVDKNQQSQESYVLLASSRPGRSDKYRAIHQGPENSLRVTPTQTPCLSGPRSTVRCALENPFQAAGFSGKC